MNKALMFLKHMKQTDTPYNFRECELDEAIEELEQAINAKTCEGCKWEQETKLITTNVGYKIDICKLCTRYENLQDRYEPKDNT